MMSAARIRRAVQDPMWDDPGERGKVGLDPIEFVALTADIW